MKTAVIVLNILMSLGLIPSILLAMTSPMIFDAGENKRLWITFFAALALPVLIIITQIASWIFFKKSNYELALKISLIPIIDLVILGFLMFKMR